MYHAQFAHSIHLILGSSHYVNNELCIYIPGSKHARRACLKDMVVGAGTDK